MIECIDIIKIYNDKKNNVQVPALRGCDLVVDKGELISIIGPSGSGKTTLINILSGLESISSGTARVNRANVSSMTKEKLNDYRLKTISIVDQFPERTLFLDASVEENVDFIFSLKEGNSLTTGEYKNKILEDLEIQHLKKRIVKTLSGGEMTRLAIACAILKRAPVMLCDEPTGQLDTENTLRVKQILRETAEKYRTTIIVVTHDLRFLKDVDKTYEIMDGRISAILTREERKRTQSFPLSLSSYVDSTKSTRIPELIYEALSLERKVEYRITKNGDVRILNPEGIEPKEIKLKSKKSGIHLLKIKSLPKNYHKNKDLQLHLSSLTKNYSQNEVTITALQSVDLEIYKGEMLFIIGPSGSGKTTLLKLISGLEPCTSGKIRYQDQNINEYDDNQRATYRMTNFGILAQQGNLHSYFTVEDNLYIKDLYMNKQQTKERQEILKKFDILHKRKAYPLELSGGELQRAGLAMANNGQPPVLVLDEPTANLDSELANKIIMEIKELNKEKKITVIIATHDFSLITDSDRVIELQDGKISRDGLASID